MVDGSECETRIDQIPPPSGPILLQLGSWTVVKVGVSVNVAVGRGMNVQVAVADSNGGMGDWIVGASIFNDGIIVIPEPLQDDEPKIISTIKGIAANLKGRIRY
jgi:hypothetical protein